MGLERREEDEGGGVAVASMVVVVDGGLGPRFPEQLPKRPAHLSWTAYSATPPHTHTSTSHTPTHTSTRTHAYTRTWLLTYSKMRLGVLDSGSRTCGVWGQQQRKQEGRGRGES